MQTYTHVVMTALFNRARRKREQLRGAGDALPPLESRAALIGSFAPDTPLILLALTFMVWDLAEGNLKRPGQDEATTSRTGNLFSDLFFNARWVKALHNLFHAPLLAAAYTLIGYWGWRRNGSDASASLFWFGAACCVHTAIDIPLHFNDGPLLFFPFDFETRFRSPVSYWDRERYGREFSIFEHGLLLIMLLFLVYAWLTD